MADRVIQYRPCHGHGLVPIRMTRSRHPGTYQGPWAREQPLPQPLNCPPY